MSSALKTATPFLKRVGIAGYDGLGALYQAPDGTLYQMQGVAADEMAGLADDDLQGFADDDISGLAEDEAFQGYVQQDGMNGLAAYTTPATAQHSLVSAA